jgi:hypothetical protein
LRIGTHHQVINIKGIIGGIITFINHGIIKGIFNGIFKGIYEGIIEGITKGFFKGIIKGIILVSLRVIDGGFCPGNEFSTLRRGLRHIRYIFLSDRLLELGIGYWAADIGYQLQFLAAAKNPAQPLLLNPIP